MVYVDISAACFDFFFYIYWMMAGLESFWEQRFISSGKETIFANKVIKDANIYNMFLLIFVSYMWTNIATIYKTYHLFKTVNLK